MTAKNAENAKNDRLAPAAQPDFAALGAHPTLVAALTRKGYAVPTPVQAAVLNASDRDLLVSSQTGSGKTVAFGLLIGRALLGDALTIPPAAGPRALVVAPTRELATQVARELGWLLAHTGARIAAFTGGTDLRRDTRALKAGVDIVVGTPGRLVDLLTRRSLDFAALTMVVLDEADEMLDLGFRESLEALLQAAPLERRTLLFSATLPRPIQTLAQRYQREALAIDPRRERRAAHEDIEHVAHLCKSGERLAALVNVLRARDDERAIVFCRTREAVAELASQLATRGFAVTFISGERAQAERTRALDALRAGRVRVLCATNVAARGLDLPDIGLVVHADLPDNAEALTHRSGRTGRAGRKGVNVFIVEAGARRRAERLFAAAHLRLRFGAAPDAREIAAHDRARLHAEVRAATATVSADAQRMAAQLDAECGAALALAALLDRELARQPAGEPLSPVALERPTPPKLPARPQRGAAPPTIARGGPMVLFTINLGHKDRAEANWILPLVCRRGGITRREIGAIRVAHDRTFFEIAAAAAAEFAANAAERDPRAPHVRIELSDSELPPRQAPAARTPPLGAARRPDFAAAAPRRGTAKRPFGKHPKRPK
jgi:ATP-dependent RNA helicase DeaD